MSYNPTENQKSIIEEKTKGIIVSASAGSGKTSTMIARIANLIKNKLTSIDRLLILTFTNAAASDMRDKLVNNLEKYVSTNQIKLETLFEIANSNISTIDAFCQNIVRKYCYEVGIDPNFGVIDDTAKTLLMENAFNNLVVKLWIKKDKTIISLIKAFSEHRKLDDLKNVVFNLYNNFCVMENYKDILTATKKSFDFNLNKNISAVYYVEYVNSVVNETLKKLDLVAQNLLHEENKKYVESLKTSLLNLKSENFLELINNANKFIVARKPSFRNNEFKQAESDFVKSELADYLSDIDKIVKTLKNSEICSNQVLEIARVNAENIFNLTSQFKEEYFALKQTRYALDFSDIEEFAFKILENEKIRNEVTSNFDYVFIDEFQDVNIMQSKLIENISGQDIFAVGDAKQSIYGFRLTSPEIFMENFNNALSKNSKIKAKILTENFRSSSTILKFVNFIFEKIMTVNTSNMCYDENSKFSINNLDKSQSAVNVYVVKKQESEQQLEKIYSVKNDQETIENNNQGLVIANIINECFLNGFTEKDIVLLTRIKSKSVVNIYNTLVELGINVSMNFDFDIKETVETSSINNFIYFINNFKNDVYMFSVLTDFYNVNLNELMLIRSKYKDEKFLYNAIQNFLNDYIEGDNLELKNIAQKLNKVFIDLNTLILYSANNNVYKVAKKIIEKFNVLQNISLDKNANIDNITKYLNELKKLELSVNEYSNLTLNTSYKVKADSSKNNIEITTIHASKGLEYKVVILIDAGKNFNYSDLKNKVIIENTFGITCSGIDVENEQVIDSIAKISAANLKGKKLFSDELRLLYVALTRAEKRLYIVGEQTLNKQADSEYKIKKCNNYLSLILSSLSKPQFEQLKNDGIVNLKQDGINFANFNYITELQNCKKAEPYILPKSNLEEVKNYSYLLKENKVKEPQILKTTVTRILENENDKKFFETLSFSDEEKTESILRGNAYHKFFELFNFKASSLEKEKERVLKILQPSELQLIDKSHIDNFINSELIEIVKQGEILKEQKFVFKTSVGAGDICLVQGIIDCLVVCDDGLIIVDYKTSNSKDIDLRRRYMPQIKAYRESMEKILGKSVKKSYLYSVFNAKLIEVCE